VARENVIALSGAPTVVPQQAPPASKKSARARPRNADAEPLDGRLSRRGRWVLLLSVLSGLITHGYHLFLYPLYSTDEGIYMERAWSLVHDGALDPYTYIYDHAPGGWIIIAAWEAIVPGDFGMFGNPVNSGRVLMLLFHAASTILLFQIARKLARGGLLAPMIATFLFNFSPLAIYYQRMALLDNMMVFWVLLSIYLLVRQETRVFAGLFSGLALGLGILTKENAIFFAPAICYLLIRRVADRPDRRFAINFWLFAVAGALSVYSLFATLKGELFPSGLNFDLTHPSGHSSLLYTLWYQLHRNQGTLFEHDSFLYTMWLPKDPFLILGGAAAMTVCLLVGFRQRRRDPAFLVAGTLAFGMALYLARGSVILDFYILPLIPILALCIALVADRTLKHPLARKAVPALIAVVLVLPTGGYLLAYGDKSNLQPNDVYYLPLTYLQQEQISWVRDNVPADAKIIIDDDIWVALHTGSRSYKYAVSHWNAVGNPAVRDGWFARSGENIDYIVMSNRMREAMTLNNTNGQENWILDALDNHSTQVWSDGRGDVQLAIYQIDHQ
jgi:4-amino-4-deoxy-L-arabinose transferase-like glycosyltransferase